MLFVLVIPTFYYHVSTELTSIALSRSLKQDVLSSPLAPATLPYDVSKTLSRDLVT